MMAAAISSAAPCCCRKLSIVVFKPVTPLLDPGALWFAKRKRRLDAHSIPDEISWRGFGGCTGCSPTRKRSMLAGLSREACMERKYIDCREFPSESGCSVAISAHSEDEVVETATQHAVQVHGQQDSPELRAQLTAGARSGMPPA